MKCFYFCLILYYSTLSYGSDSHVLYSRLTSCQTGVNNSSLRSECVKLVVRDGLMLKIEEVFEIMVQDSDPNAATWANFILVELRQGQYYDLNRETSKKVLLTHHQFIYDHGFTFRSYLDLGFKKSLGLPMAVTACLLHADIDCLDAGVLAKMTQDQKKQFTEAFLGTFAGRFMEIFSLAQLMPPENTLSHDSFFLAAQLYKRNASEGREAIKKFAQENSSHLCDYQMTLVLREVSLSKLFSHCSIRPN